MQLFLRKNIFLFFWMIAAVEILSQFSNAGILHFIFKPLLLPVLIIAVFLCSSPSEYRQLLITGLFFSFAGDVFLLFEDWNSIYFIVGLICFLLTHIFYCWYFLKIKKTGKSLLKQQPLLIILVLAYTGSLVWLLFPKLGDLTIPVIVYAAILTAMLLCSLHAFNFMNTVARKFIIAGTLSFVISDSLLAINKFYAAFSYAGFFIMLTYCIAQYLIVKGFIKNGV